MCPFTDGEATRAPTLYQNSFQLHNVSLSFKLKEKLK